MYLGKCFVLLIEQEYSALANIASVFSPFLGPQLQNLKKQLRKQYTTFFFCLTPGIQSFAPTNPKDAQALKKEFPASAIRLIQGVHSQSYSPKKHFALDGFLT